MLRALAVTLAAIAASLVAAPAAHAYVRSRSPPDGRYDIIWPDPQVMLTVRLGGKQVVPMNDFVTAAMNAAAAWSDPALDSSVALSIATSSDGPSDPAFDHQNTIDFRTVDWDTGGRSAGQLALTTVWTQGGKIVDTDTEINAHDTDLWALLPDDPTIAAASPDIDLQATLTHELGHVLGLDHPCYLGDTPPNPPEMNNEGMPVPSCSDPNLPDSVRAATMYPSANHGSISERTLSPDEVLALHDIYPAGRAPVVEGAPAAAAGGCAVAGTSGPTRGAGAVLGLALALPALFARRRTRRLGC
jgi:hypothetical protein